MTSSVGGRVSLAAGANLLSGQISDRNSDATCFVGSIDLKVTEDIIWELFTQVGPVGASMINAVLVFAGSRVANIRLLERRSSFDDVNHVYMLQCVYIYQKIE
jgi:hypothetical protein